MTALHCEGQQFQLQSKPFENSQLYVESECESVKLQSIKPAHKHLLFRWEPLSSPWCLSTTVILCSSMALLLSVMWEIALDSLAGKRHAYKSQFPLLVQTTNLLGTDLHMWPFTTQYGVLKPLIHRDWWLVIDDKSHYLAQKKGDRVYKAGTLTQLILELLGMCHRFNTIYSVNKR